MTEIRKKVRADTGVINAADGSCRLWLGDTEVLVAVYGPEAMRTQKELADRALLQVSVTPSNVILEQTVENTLGRLILLNKFPRCAIRIEVDIVLDAGSVNACVFNAAMIAVLDAGIPCIGCAYAVETCSIGDETRTMVLEPTRKQQEEASFKVFAVIMNNASKDVVSWLQDGVLTKASVAQSELYRMAVERVEQVDRLCRDVFTAKYGQMIADKGIVSSSSSS
jgi:ribonuclease PH